MELLTQEVAGMWPSQTDEPDISNIDVDLATRRPMIVSKKRMRNLCDFANIWCKTLVYGSLYDNEPHLSQLSTSDMDGME
jgi:hypothetical protein